MAVLRPDQAQLTIMKEPSAGADPDRVAPTSFVTSSGTPTSLDSTGPAVYLPGATKVYVANWANKEAGDFISIGTPTASSLYNPTTAQTNSTTTQEVRRIEHVEKDNTGTKGWLHLDRPLAFRHEQANTSIPTYVYKVLTVLTADLTADEILGTVKGIPFVPGVYDTIDTPDPAMALEPRYFLGQSSMRNFTSLYSGQHTYQGALNGIILLNGWPLRWGIGTEIPVPRGVTSSSVGHNAIKAGEVWVKCTGTATTTPTGAAFTIGSTTSSHIYGWKTAYTMANSDPTNVTATDPPEVNTIKRVVANSAWIEYKYPFKFDHAAGTIRYITSTDGITHYLVEQNDLDSMCWHLGMKDSTETDTQRFDRRWLGGKVGAMSILAEEGGLLTVNWDSVVFKDMIHNQPSHTSSVTRYALATATTTDDGATTAGQVMPGYAIMNKYDVADINLPTTEPYYFSGGSVKLIDGTEFARVRGFNIAINNNEDPRYYIGQRHGNHKGPSEIREQRREYSMTCTLALPDTGSNSAMGVDKATSLFKELLLEGRYAANGGHKGFNISLKFVRGTFVDSGTVTWEDAIWIDIPGIDKSNLTNTLAGGDGSEDGNAVYPGSLSQALSGTVNGGGAFIRGAPHTITTDAPLQVAVDMVFRSMTIVVRDQEPYYP